MASDHGVGVRIPPGAPRLMEEEILTRKDLKRIKKEEKQAENSNILVKIFVLLAIFVVGFALFKLSRPESKENLPDNALGTYEEDWTKGKMDSSVVLIEYLDFQCPACRSYYPIVKSVLDEYQDRILFVVRHFPLTNIHKNAFNAAVSAEAAGRQDKFWEMYDILFEKQTEWAVESDPKNLFVQYAEEIGMDKDKFLSDYEDPQLKEKVENSRKNALEIGARGTPTFVLNGRIVPNPKDIEGFRILINEELN